MRSCWRLVLMIAVICGGASSVEAWTPATNRYVVENAARTMPKGLRAILYTHREALFAGATRPGSDEAFQEHHYTPEPGKGLRARVLGQTALVRRLLAERAPFQEVAREMGVLGHFLADANNPLHVLDDDPREDEYILDYSRYVETNLPKFPLVFSGYHAPTLAEGDVEGFVDAILDRSRRHYPRIGQDYIRRGRLVSSSVFDEFSFAFGIGALSTSHAVADTAKLWLHLWKEAGGDVSDLPYAGGPSHRPAAEAHSSGR